MVDGVHGSYSSGEVVEIEPGGLLHFATWFDRTDPERPLFNPEKRGILHSKNLVAETIDNGDTWSAWRESDLRGLKGARAPERTFEVKITPTQLAKREFGARSIRRRRFARSRRRSRRPRRGRCPAVRPRQGYWRGCASQII